MSTKIKLALVLLIGVLFLTLVGVPMVKSYWNNTSNSTLPTLYESMTGDEYNSSLFGEE